MQNGILAMIKTTDIGKEDIKDCAVSVNSQRSVTKNGLKPQRFKLLVLKIPCPPRTHLESMGGAPDWPGRLYLGILRLLPAVVGCAQRRL